MSSLTIIEFDDKLFSDADCSALLLYESSTFESLPISRPNVLSFIRTFNRISTCQQYVNTNSQKRFTLFAYSENMVLWLKKKFDMPNNLTKIVIFCRLDEDKYYLQKWTRRYSEKIKKIVTFVQLEYELLFFGIEYIQDLMKQSKDNLDLYFLLEEKYQQLCSNLGNYFDKAISHVEKKLINSFFFILLNCY